MLLIDFDGLRSRRGAEWRAGLIGGGADLWNVCGDVDESSNLRIVSGLGDDCTAPGVTDQDHRPILKRDQPASGIGIVFERRERILNGDDMKSARFEDRNDLSPTRSISESAVNQQDVLDGL